MKALPWIFAGVGIGAFVYVLLNQQTPAYPTGDPDIQDAANRTSAWGTKQRVTGTGGKLTGKAKEGIGKVTGNDELAGEGLVDQVTGSVKDAAGKAAHAVSDTINELNK